MPHERPLPATSIRPGPRESWMTPLSGTPAGKTWPWVKVPSKQCSSFRSRLNANTRTFPLSWMSSGGLRGDHTRLWPCLLLGRSSGPPVQLVLTKGAGGAVRGWWQAYARGPTQDTVVSASTSDSPHVCSTNRGGQTADVSPSLVSLKSHRSHPHARVLVLRNPIPSASAMR
jgi:hypothetical protein